MVPPTAWWGVTVEAIREGVVGARGPGQPFGMGRRSGCVAQGPAGLGMVTRDQLDGQVRFLGGQALTRDRGSVMKAVPHATDGVS